MYIRPLCAHSDGGWGLVSNEEYLLAKLAPLLVEYSTFRLSLPSPCPPRYSVLLSEASVGLTGLVSGSTTLFENPVMLFPEMFTWATLRLSLPSPFQVIKRVLFCTQSSGACGL